MGGGPLGKRGVAKMKKVCIIPGDDAAPEAVLPAVEILRSMELPIEFLLPPTGEEGIRKHGAGFPEEARRAVDESDTTIFGATSGVTGGLSYLRSAKDTYANLRPIKYLPGMRSPLAHPQGIDLVLVRENSEDAYVGIEGDLQTLDPSRLAPDRRTGEPLDVSPKGKFAIKVITEAGTRRIAKFACDLALRRKREGRPGRLTITSKYNLLRQTDGLFKEVAEEVARGYPDLRCETLIVDNFAQQLMIDPKRFDVVVIPNLYGDILSDGAAGLIGGLGAAPSGCYGDRFAYFEPVHGSAPDIKGQNVINPTATLLSAAMMLEYLGLPDDARRLTDAIAGVYAEGAHLTRDQHGTAGTTEFCAAVQSRLVDTGV